MSRKALPRRLQEGLPRIAGFTRGLTTPSGARPTGLLKPTLSGPAQDPDPALPRADWPEDPVTAKPPAPGRTRRRS